MDILLLYYLSKLFQKTFQKVKLPLFILFLFWLISKLSSLSLSYGRNIEKS
ncbi:hypothetical protein SAMN03080606_00410 [Alkaliphilus peptidifermentans DSM 18978]|uniref:Uncharacterized protein n=1 Tax=Alkaliphilus peptidifermentans DSM 18978 TaxID=1120976 RepID=A0A1G5BGC8_9FIRM|nr:hypothetical protein SAMN03080606_00410 [Alkaliphilus peptidifermentans DSM 18978]